MHPDQGNLRPFVTVISVRFSQCKQSKLKHGGKKILLASDVFLLLHTFAIFESEAVLRRDASVKAREKPAYRARISQNPRDCVALLTFHDFQRHRAFKIVGFG